MPKTKKETPQIDPKKKHEPPVSLYPMTFEQAMKSLLKVPHMKTKKD
jgi:hypothetical protein